MSIECISICAPLGGMPMNVPGVASAVGVAPDDGLAVLDHVVDLHSKVLEGVRKP